MLTHFVLPHSLRPLYSSLTYPHYAPMMEDPGVICIGIANIMEPIGLLVGRIKRDVGEVLSLCVAPPYRRQGHAHELLACFEQELRRQQIGQASLTYLTNHPYLEAVESLLNSSGWNKKKARMLFIKYTLMQRTLPEWVHWKYPTGFATDPFNSLTEEERKLIKEQSTLYPHDLNPLSEERNLEDSNSLLLRHNGTLAGWVVTHRISPLEIRYTSLFVAEHYQKLGLGIRLIGDAVKRQYAQRKEIPHALHAISYERPEMIRFAKRYLYPVAENVYESWQASKLL